jgi:hypothetical protein
MMTHAGALDLAGPGSAAESGLDAGAPGSDGAPLVRLESFGFAQVDVGSPQHDERPLRELPKGAILRTGTATSVVRLCVCRSWRLLPALKLDAVAREQRGGDPRAFDELTVNVGVAHATGRRAFF